MREPVVLEGTYEVLEKIGSGGGGVVYRAWHRRLQKEVVLKLLKAGTAASLATQRAEVDILKNLKHPYLPQVYDFVDDGVQVYTVMEYIPGESFYAKLKRGERFEQRLVVKWMGQLCEALEYLHGQNPAILHSDVKPANVMLTPEGDVCLIDFNIALMLGDGGGVAVGRSHGYASPEQYDEEELERIARQETEVQTEVLSGGESTLLAPDEGQITTRSLYSHGDHRQVRMDARSDIYSLGATLYHILTGRRPSASPAGTPPISSLNCCSEGVCRLVERAMAADPDKRYQTAREMLDAVRGIRRLDRRWKRQRVRQAATAALLSALFGLFAVCAFTGLRQMEMEKQIAVLMEYSANALADGNPREAVRLALEALPQGGLLRPRVPEARRTLADALGTYDLSDGFKPYDVLRLPSAPQLLEISPEGTYGAAFYPFVTRVFRLEDSRLEAEIPMERSALAQIRFLSDNLLICAGEGGLCVYDIAAQQVLWTGRPATGIALSADGSVIAAVYKDEGEARLYSADGAEIGAVSFQGRGQPVPVDDSFADPAHGLFALNRDGSRLAVSFSDGSLTVFHTRDLEENLHLYEDPEAAHFEGGFCGDYLAFSAAKADGESVFVIVDITVPQQTVGMRAQGKFSVLAGDDGVYLAHGNLLVEMDPADGEQSAVASVGGGIAGFVRNGETALLGADDGTYTFTGPAAGQYGSSYLCDTLALGERWALAGGLNSTAVRIHRRVDNSAADYFTFATSDDFSYSEARVNAEETRILLYSYRRFRLYDRGGALMSDVPVPDAQRVTDQQYDADTGNLSVLYPDALRIYAGTDGSPVLERTELRSVCYSPYGISLLDREGTLSLVSPSGEETAVAFGIDADFAAACGGILLRRGEKLYFSADGVEKSLGTGELLGAARKSDGSYLFAVCGYPEGTLYAVERGTVKELFSFPVGGQAEAYFVLHGRAMVLSPLHGSPDVYETAGGKKIRDLEQDAYLTGVSELEGYVIAEYMETTGRRYALLLEPDRFEILASLPGFTDTVGGDLLTDTRAGALRRVPVKAGEVLRDEALELLAR